MGLRKQGPGDGRSVRRFVAVFLGLFALFQLVYYGLLVDSAAFKAYVGASNRLAAATFSLGGEPATSSGDVLSAGISLSVRKGCDGIQTMGVLAIAIALLRGSPTRKVIGIAVGVLGIALLNTLRLASLLWIGDHSPDWFQVAHVHLWPAILVAFAAIYTIVWMRWAEPE